MRIDNPCIKTGAWLWVEPYNHGLKCDLYRVGTALIARIIAEQAPVQMDNYEDYEWWATMYDITVDFIDAHNGSCTMKTYISGDYLIHKQYEFDYVTAQYVAKDVSIRVG